MAKAKAETAATKAATVYIGPGTTGGGLLMQSWTVYKGGDYPAPVAARIAADADFAALFVPVDGLASARLELAREGSAINRAALAVARKYRKGA